MRNVRNNEVIALASSIRYFTDIKEKPIAIKKTMPEFDEILNQLFTQVDFKK